MELTPCRLSWGKVSSRGCFVGCASSHGSGHSWNFVAGAISRCEGARSGGNLITWEIRGTRPTSPTGDFGCSGFTRECANSPRMTPPPPIPCGGTSRDELFRSHPSSPLLPEHRAAFTRLAVADYDPAWRFEVVVEPAAESRRLDVATGTDGVVPFELLGTARIPDVGALDVWRLASYAGGIFLPMRDGLAGTARRHLRRRTLPARHRQGCLSGDGTGDNGAGDSASSSTSISPTTRPAPTTRCGPVRCRKPATGSAPRCP